jgi:hypothetical protein
MVEWRRDIANWGDGVSREWAPSHDYPVDYEHGGKPLFIPQSAPALQLDNLVSNLVAKDAKVREESASHLIKNTTSQAKLQCSAKRQELLAVALKSHEPIVRDAAVAVLTCHTIDTTAAMPTVCQVFWDAIDEVARNSAGQVLAVKYPSVLFSGLYDEDETHRRASTLFLAGRGDVDPEQTILQYMRGDLFPSGCIATPKFRSYVISSRTRYAAIAVHGQVNNRVPETVRTLVAVMFSRHSGYVNAVSAWLGLKAIFPTLGLLDCLGSHYSYCGANVHTRLGGYGYQLEAIRELDVGSPEVLLLLRRILANGRWAAQIAVLAKLAQSGRRATEAIRPIRRLLITGAPLVRAGCVDCLVNIGSLETIPDLLRTVRVESDRSVREKAARGLLAIAPHDRALMKNLRTVLQNDAVVYRRLRPSILALLGYHRAKADQTGLTHAKLMAVLGSRDIHSRVVVQTLLEEQDLIHRLHETARHWQNLGDAPDDLVLSFLGDLLERQRFHGFDIGYRGANFAALTAWLDRCFRNWLKKRYRGQSRRRSRNVSFDPTQFPSDALPPSAIVETSDFLTTLFNTLEPRDRLVFMASVFDDLTFEDITVHHGVSKSQVETSLTRGRRTLRREIGRLS